MNKWFKDRQKCETNSPSFEMINEGQIGIPNCKNIFIFLQIHKKMDKLGYLTAKTFFFFFLRCSNFKKKKQSNVDPSTEMLL